MKELYAGPGEGGGENLTLSQAELAACRPVRSGQSLRAFCPFHGSDRQRSLRVNLATGRFQCFACNSWGYTAEARADWLARQTPARPARPASGPVRPPSRNTPPALPPVPVRPGPPEVRGVAAARPAYPLDQLARQYREALTAGSWGAEYLQRRGIGLELARQYGAGYAAPGQWAHHARDWKWGRVVFPHTGPDGQLLNFYGRAVGSLDKVPKAARHDHLPGAKGYFNAAALRDGTGPLFITEGVFDALSLIAAGYPRTVAIFGLNGWRWEWLDRAITRLVFALDADGSGQAAWRELARQAVLRGKQVAFLPPEAYGSHKDLNEAWVAGVLQPGAWPEPPLPPVELRPEAGRGKAPGTYPDTYAGFLEALAGCATAAEVALLRSQARTSPDLALSQQENFELEARSRYYLLLLAE